MLHGSLKDSRMSMSSLDCSCEKQALEFMALYERELNEIRETYGMVSANFKPLCIREPVLTEKYAQARKTLRLNYWQMPYNEAKKKFRGLPFKTWQAKAEAPH